MKNNSKLKCRFCSSRLNHTFIDLGMSPISNAYPTKEELNKGEKFFPLHVYVCSKCFLVQLPEFQTPEELFSEYAYFSSYSSSWLTHAKKYVEKITKKLKLNSKTQVIEVASNDGYLLQYFVKKNIPVLGIDPAKNIAKVACKAGIPTLVAFFGKKLAQQLVKSNTKADLLIGNNVLAQVPEINDFIRGLKLILKENGIITMEFPHLLKLIKENQFDTIYHEHFSYFSLFIVEEIFKSHGLAIFDVEELPTHGGSLRIYAKHIENHNYPVSKNVKRIKTQEFKEQLDNVKTYKKFQKQVQSTKKDLINFLKEQKKQNKSVVGYGAPAKGNTFLNYCGVGSEFIKFTVDKNPYKQNRFLPGIHIPIYSPEKIMQEKPDYIFILPWNIKDEIIEQMGGIRNWGGRFLVAIPELKTY